MKFTKFQRAGLCLTAIILFLHGLAQSQTLPDEDGKPATWKWWAGAGAEIDLSERLAMSLGFIKAFNLEQPVTPSFTQTSGSFDYSFTKHFDVKAGFVSTLSPPAGNGVYRYFARTSFKCNLTKRINWTNGIQFEKFSAREKRFDSRFVYMTRFGWRKRVTFLRFSPSIAYWLYYNLGGNAIPQYDDDGMYLGKKVPSGFHRGRFILNLNFKITEALFFSAYYLRQDEFNLFSSGRNIHVTQPETGKIYRPFSNYQVAGTTLKLSI